jgi:hypothetical protein
MDYNNLFEFKVGDVVHDDLTGHEAIVIGVSYENGTVNHRLAEAIHTVGYWLNNDYLGGGRHPWEISKIDIFLVCPFTQCYITKGARVNQGEKCKWSIRTEHGEADCGYG